MLLAEVSSILQFKCSGSCSHPPHLTGEKTSQCTSAPKPSLSLMLQLPSLASQAGSWELGVPDRCGGLNSEIVLSKESILCVSKEF